ncbi:MAG: hypothetical protein SP1CHLAM9_03280 [Chlamydiia bacterium]|nr:hypothetical protein [Chlamydiia bacterium]
MIRGTFYIFQIMNITFDQFFHDFPSNRYLQLTSNIVILTAKGGLYVNTRQDYKENWGKNII